MKGYPTSPFTSLDVAVALIRSTLRQLSAEVFSLRRASKVQVDKCRVRRRSLQGPSTYLRCSSDSAPGWEVAVSDPIHPVGHSIDCRVPVQPTVVFRVGDLTGGHTQQTQVAWALAGFCGDCPSRRLQRELVKQHDWSSAVQYLPTDRVA